MNLNKKKRQLDQCSNKYDTHKNESNSYRNNSRSKLLQHHQCNWGQCPLITYPCFHIVWRGIFSWFCLDFFVWRGLFSWFFLLFGEVGVAWVWILLAPSFAVWLPQIFFGFFGCLGYFLDFDFKDSFATQHNFNVVQKNNIEAVLNSLMLWCSQVKNIQANVHVCQKAKCKN